MSPSGYLTPFTEFLLGLVISVFTIIFGLEVRILPTTFQRIIAASTIISSIGLDVASVWTSINDPRAFWSSVGTLITDIWNGIVRNASFWDLLEIYLTIGAGVIADVFSGGAAAIAGALIGVYSLISDTALFFATAFSTYNSKYNS